MKIFLNICYLQAATLEALKNDDIDLFRDLVNERVVNDGSNARKGNKKLVDIELQYEDENDKTLLQVAVDEGKAEALQVSDNSLRVVILILLLIF